MKNPTWGDGKTAGSEKWEDGNTFNSGGCIYQRWCCYRKLWVSLSINLFIPDLFFH